MPREDTFSPRWASPPGDTIRDVLEDRRMDLQTLSNLIGMHKTSVARVVEQGEPISLDLARRLADVLGPSVEFWVTRDCQYRDDLARVEADRWMTSLPLAEMSEFGWVHRESDWTERLRECLRFFGVDSVEAWRLAYGSVVDSFRFRLSPTVPLNPGSVVAWLRQGETLARQVEGGPWDPRAFRQSLDEARSLTRQRDPEASLANLASMCNRVGVAVIVLRPPRGTPVSGATRFLTNERALILLSGRYLSDDHLWFTFFHEAGHLVLHDRHRTYVDNLDPKAQSEDREEAEASRFAQELLVADSVIDELRRGPLSARRIAKAARDIGVAPGILVGQLQHAGIVSFDKWNGLKRRYRWAGTTLEMA